MQCVAACLQRVTVCWCVAVQDLTSEDLAQCAAVCCSVFTARCSVQQYVGVLKCVAVFAAVCVGVMQRVGGL